MRLGHLGPEGTFSEAAAREAASDAQLVGYPTVVDVVEAVLAGEVQRGVVPIENSVEGTVTATVDALTAGERLTMVGESVLAVTQCLIAREDRPLDEFDSVLSHPQGLAQCARFLRTQMLAARPVPVASTAEAVRLLADAGPAAAAIGGRAAAAAHGALVLREAIEDEPGNATRFAWLALAGGEPFPPRPRDVAWKTSVLFAGAGDGSPGWLVRCLSEFDERGVNLVRIESRPARRRLGRYLFLADCEGRADTGPVADAIGALSTHCDQVRVLGSYPAAPDP